MAAHLAMQRQRHRVQTPQTKGARTVHPGQCLCRIPRKGWEVPMCPLTRDDRPTHCLIPAGLDARNPCIPFVSPLHVTLDTLNTQMSYVI
eukprot:351537-Chlamydomonas_euryale.AAC.2